VAINQKHFVDILPLVVALLAKLSIVREFLRVVYIDIPTGLPLPNCVILNIIPNGVFVTDVLWTNVLVEFHKPFPWSYFHSR